MRRNHAPKLREVGNPRLRLWRERKNTPKTVSKERINVRNERRKQK